MRRLLALAAVAFVVAAACSSAPDEIVLLTHDSFLVSDEVLAAFEAESGVAVRVLTAGDAGQLVSQAILTKDSPTADVIYGIDNTFLSRALEEDLFRPHQAEGLETVPATLKLDEQNRVTPVDYGDVCVNFDIAELEERGVPVPQSLADLTDPAYRGMLVAENPSSASPGLAFLMATIATFGEDGEYTWQDYWADLIANDVLITDDWTQAYTVEFSGGSPDGDRPLVVSYASSPPAGVFFSDPQPAEAPTGSMLDGCFRQIEFAGILEGTRYPAEAEHLVDFMLSTTFQEDMPLNMFVFPANSDAELPDLFTEFAQIPPEPVTLSPSAIAENRDRWINEWFEIVR